MKPKKREYSFKDSDLYDEYFDLNKVQSNSECTGLIQTPPSNEEEAESYTALYNIPKPDTHTDRAGKRTKRK